MSCCDDKICELDALRSRQSGVLKAVLAINATMFVVEATAGWLADSVALLADSLDMLGDALVYGFSLYGLNRGARWQARSALLKGGIMAAFGLFVLGETLHKILIPVVPSAPTIGAVGMLALAANLSCLGLLWRHRADDINMRSVWLCSRNDVIANIGVLVAALGVAVTASGWPDIAVGLVIGALFLRSAAHVLGAAIRQLRPTTA